MKNLLFILSFLFLTTSLCAQSNDVGTMEPVKEIIKRRILVTTVTFGPTVDWFTPTTENMVKTGASVGFRGGIGFDIDVKKNQKLFVTTGIMVRYLNSGVDTQEKYNINDTMVTYNVTRSLSNLSIVIPTGVKLKTLPRNNCVFAGSFGFYHGFTVRGRTSDDIELLEGTDGDGNPIEFDIETTSMPHDEGSLYSFTPYAGMGFEYQLKNGQRASIYAQYAPQVSNYFTKKAVSINGNSREKALIHSLEIMLGFSF